MLHEILLSLSGHPSPLLDTKNSTATDRSIDFPLLSPPEQALIQSIGRLARLHRDVRSHATYISSSHASTIARAVATAITTIHLARFQNKILDVETTVLRKDTTSVGAYNIVPLAAVVGDFDEWTRRLDWYWQLVCFIQPLNAPTLTSQGSAPCSGAALIDKLRQEAQTGYPDIEVAALELGKVAETAWLRQLSSWVLYGRLPLVGAQDFFVQQTESDNSADTEYDTVSSLLPRFVSRDTATSILFIGKSLNTIRIRGRAHEYGSKSITEMDLVPTHLQHLAKLVFPLSSSSLATAIGAIRRSLSRNTLQQLLPLSSILQVLSLLRDFFLLRRGEFAISLINEADACLQARNRSTKTPDSLRGMLIKDAELTTILMKTFPALATSADDDAGSILDSARSLLRFQVARPNSTRPSTPGRAKAVENLPHLSPVMFNDLLLPTPTNLTIDIIAPFDLFLTPAEISIYSALQAYILSLRRAHLRISSLWRQTPIRRTYPTPLGPPHTSRPHTARILATKRERATRRNHEMRALWATCSATVFLLGEMGNYFEGEVIDQAWTRLQDWITQKPVNRPSSARSRPNGSRRNFNTSPRRSTVEGNDIAESLEHVNFATNEEESDSAPAPHDPAILTTAHRVFLTALAHSLLITDLPFTTSLRDLLRNIDNLVALVTRLQSIQESLDLEEDEGVVDPMGDFAKQEEEVKRELGRARKRVDAGLRVVVERLRVVDQEGGVGDAEDSEGELGAFVPSRGAGVERLLMRIEGGRRTNVDEDEEDDDVL